MTEFSDIAIYQRGADIATYARTGRDRILLKASEGTGYVNPLFSLWWSAAGVLGLARGAYHYAKPSRWTGEAEAEHFHRTLAAAGGLGDRDWVCLDVEEPDQEGRAAHHAANFCARMVELGHGQGVIYSGTYYLGPARLTPERLPPGWRQLHIANYNRTPDDRVPLPPGWTRAHVVARQYTSSAVTPGIPGGSDANRVVREWLDAGSEEPVTPEDREAIATRVLELLRDEVFGVQPEIRQGRRAGTVIGATYNKVGDAQSALARLGEQVGLVGVALHAGRDEIRAVGEKVDALTTIAGTEPVMAELGEFAGVGLNDIDAKLDALLDHLGVDYPPALPARATEEE